MPKMLYVDKKFTAAHRTLIDHANTIIEEYAEQGFDLTLRQLYYQFVSRDLIQNTVQEYKRLGGIIGDARLAGLIDWERITDRVRNLVAQSHWGKPGDILQSAAASFHIDKWRDQPRRVEVWAEKDALSGVFEPVCAELDVPFFACRGYTSVSAMWAAGRRLRRHRLNDQLPVILHFGDHDPSGLDMTRDVTDRLGLFAEATIEVERLALNMDQIEQYTPPPNPAKETDSRYKVYLETYGQQSWELDALNPTTLAAIVRTRIEALRDDELWDEAVAEETRHREQLQAAADQWDELVQHLDTE